MNKGYSNPCIRCGTERIVKRTWKERVGSSVITNTLTICPNPKCQKEVDLDNKRIRDKSAALKLQSEERAQKRNELRLAKKAQKPS